jgi:hypothetical protein
MRQSLEIGMPLFLGKGEAGLRITSLRRLVADQKGDRRPLEARSFSCRKRMVDQCLHQSASAMQWQRRDVFDKPVVLATLYPAAVRISAAPKYRSQLGRIQPRVFGRFLDRRSPGATRPGRRRGAECGRRLSFDLGNDELRNVPPRLPVCGGNPFYKGKALRFGPVQRNVEPAARPVPALRGHYRPCDKGGIVDLCPPDRKTPLSHLSSRDFAYLCVGRERLEKLSLIHCEIVILATLRVRCHFRVWHLRDMPSRSDDVRS